MLSWAAKTFQNNDHFLSVARSPKLYILVTLWIFMTVSSGTRHPGLQGQENVSHKLLSAPDPGFFSLSSAHIVFLSPSSGWSNQTGSNGSSSCGQLVLIFSRVQSLQNLRRKEATFPSTVHGHSWGQAGWRLLLCLKVCCASETKKAKDSIFPPQEAYCLINKD